MVVQSQCREAVRLSIALFLHHCNTWIRQSSCGLDSLIFGKPEWLTGWVLGIPGKLFFFLGKPWYLVFPGLPVLSVVSLKSALLDLQSAFWNNTIPGMISSPALRGAAKTTSGFWQILKVGCSQIPLYPWLVVWNICIHLLFFHILGIIIPTDELHHLSEG